MKHLLIIVTLILSSSIINGLFSQQDCASATVISSLTYSEIGLSTIGTENNYSSSDACTSTGMENEEYVFSFTPIANAQINVTLSNTEIVTGSLIPFANIGLYIIEACPDDVASVCIATSDDLMADPFIENINLIAGTTYYIIVSSANTALGDATNVNFDMEITENYQNDIGITAIIEPYSGCGLSDEETVTIEITNFGATSQTDIPVNYSSDGGTTWLASDEIITITLAPEASAEYTFTETSNLSIAGEYEFHAKTNLFEDENPSNDEQLHIIISQATIPAADYLESFESGAAGWYTNGSNSTMELAMPINTLISSAGEGDYAWVTNADGFNDPAEISYLESPCFDFSSFTNPKFKAMIQYETTQILTNFYLEYSIDGTLWDTVQDGGASTNWYGTDLMAFGTWGGSSAGWITIATNIPEIAGQSSVKFRFNFNNGTMSMADTEGVAIDQINIYDCTDIPTASFSFDIDGTMVNFQNESTNATTYEWNFGDNEIIPSTSTEENPSFSYLMDGTYTVTLIATNDCSSVEYSTIIDISTGIQSNPTEGISIYPNPAKDILNISLSNNTSFIYQIINISGEIIEESNINSKQGIINIKNISAGLYYIKILTAETTQITSFIKE